MTYRTPEVSPDAARRRQRYEPIERPPEVPWSLLAPDFNAVYARNDKGDFTGEHAELTGQSGSGKSYVLGTVIQGYVRQWNTGAVIICTKQQDDSIPLLGWPIVQSFDDLRDYRWAVFWPQTNLMGDDKEKYDEQRIYDLLTRLWTKDANLLLSFDEIGYVEGLSRRVRKLIRQMWREARSHKLAILAMKQRPIGVSRDQHSESRWKFVFPPADEGDMQRFAELLGPAPQWAPILRSLDQEQHQFIVRNTFTKEAFISWVDTPLRPLPSQQHQEPRSTNERLYGQQQVSRRRESRRREVRSAA